MAQIDIKKANRSNKIFMYIQIKKIQRKKNSNCQETI